MTAPPGTAPTTQPFGELITGTRLDLSTRNGQLRYLVDELGVTRRQAQALIRAYVLDQRDADARQYVREEFGRWLKSNYWAALRGGLFAKASA